MSNGTTNAGTAAPPRLDRTAVLVAALAGGAVAATVTFAQGRARARQRRLEAAELSAHVAHLRLENLRAQLCPHFLFNALNAASALITADPEAAERMLAQISELLRIALRMEGVQKVLLAEELSFVEKYLAVERIRFGSRLDVRYRISDDVLGALAPNFLLQPIVENAVHHGIAPRSEPGHLLISAARAGTELRIAVRDDGPGLPAGGSARAGAIGLRNTRARLDHLYGRRYRFTLGNAAGGGVLADVRIPYEAASPVPDTSIDPAATQSAAGAGAAGPRRHTP